MPVDSWHHIPGKHHDREGERHPGSGEKQGAEPTRTGFTKSGKVVWKDRRAEKGNCPLAERLLYGQGDEGTATLIDPSPKGYRELGRFRISRPKTNMPYVPGGNMRTVPAIANGRLYIRDLDTLCAYEIRR